MSTIKKIAFNKWSTIPIITLFVFSCLFVNAGIVKSQIFGETFVLLVKINGESDSVNEVSIELNGENLGLPVTRMSILNGWALISNLAVGNYTLTPTKTGYFFEPSSLNITINNQTEKWTLITFMSQKGNDPEAGLTIPFQAEWASSAHADVTAEAFNHWNEDGEIPTSCARCHSTAGVRDFLGDDGTQSGVVDSAVAIGNVITCEACHNKTAVGLKSVTFPSGETVNDLGHESICMTCHQGRASAVDVDAAIEKADVADDDTVSEELGFINIHYFAAAATLYGKFAKGGYQYDGKSYDGRLAHVEGVNRCIDCHNPHTLKIKVELCATCHKNVIKQEDVFNIRMNGSLVDYDGDGDMTEGIFFEIETLREKLLEVIQAYAKEKTGVAIVYDSHTYPYFFIDTNGDGIANVDEANFGNRYNAWSARLLKAAYNYQVSLKDPGAFAHGGKYIIELIYDSIEDVNSVITTQVAMAGTSRTDEAHFDGSAEAFRHWDDDGAVPASCAKCHGVGGLATFLKNDATIATSIPNGMLCSTCHTDLTDFTKRRSVEAVTFPSGLTADLGDESNLCITCHQGRNSKSSVDDAIAASSGPYSFINIHYYPVAATFFGTDVEGGYEFAGRDYAGQSTFSSHLSIFDTCVECHMGIDKFVGNKSHNLTKPDPANCVICHGEDVSQSNPGTDANLFAFKEIRPDDFPDYDGDGSVSESLWSEIKGLEEALFAQIQAYATEAGNPIIYEAHTYPYFFNDSNGNGSVDDGEASFSNGFKLFDASLLKAAYNYQVSLKEPCGYIHNNRYVAQLLVDSIEVLGGDISVFSWR